jgi:metallophosphoesterase (TIGR00282 family)
MNVLMIGDVVGKPGRRAVSALVPGLRDELSLDLVVANGENVAAGRGLTENTARELFEAGVDVITSGNHIWDQKEILAILDQESPILRPANYPPGVAGRGWMEQNGVTVLNLQGRTFMLDIDCPLRAADAALAEMPPSATVVVDFHAEATAEKEALGRYLDGRVAAVVGTHTHVPTADATIFPGGTAYVSDAGKVGAAKSVIGFEIEAVVQRQLTALPLRLPVEEDESEVLFNSVLVQIDETTRKATRVQRVDRTYRQHG